MKTDERRADLVDAAYRLIAEKGIEGLRTRDVAAEVGINISTFHYHFDTKEKLIAAVVDHVTQLFKTLHPALPDDATPRERLVAMFEIPLYRRKKAPELEIVVNETMLHARRNTALRKTFDRMIDEWRDGVEHVVRACIETGDVRADVDAKVAASLITTFLMGATLQLGLRPSFSLADTSQALLGGLLAPKRRGS